ncbi:hypothetical protein [Dyella terrae]|uniref:hypothetical protein n=1 Tax=Dyella terrae TaxID=522259 RepID=UPI001EFCE083|nr:hypothetical protein [Dyella terrae]ULU23624.1 NnrS family protein [Dyella terrae]
MLYTALQLVALIRIAGEYMSPPWPWYIAAAALWLLALTPWVARSLWMYLTPGRDGAPG